MNLFGASDPLIDWHALGQVIYISAIAGIAIASVLGIGITSSLRAQGQKGGTALALNAVLAVSILLVAGAVVLGIHFITDK
jgi:UPF0716 family protein affecting phage T7 exclusion